MDQLNQVRDGLLNGDHPELREYLTIRDIEMVQMAEVTEKLHEEVMELSNQLK